MIKFEYKIKQIPKRGMAFMKILKRIILVAIIAILTIALLSFYSKTYAVETTYVTLSDNGISAQGDDTVVNSLDGLYLTTSTNNGGTSEEATNANIQIASVINIAGAGTYEFTGSISDAQIAVNTNNINGDVTIILNNANITCKSAPVIFVYNKLTNSSTCNVIIKTVNDTTNTITGGKIKQSVQDWQDQSALLYYVEKDYDDDGSYYERYKYDGAISSDISLTFEGEGELIVNSLAKEGIESKRNITVKSGKYTINSLDDGINACADNESIITIDGGTVLVNVTSEAEEGDGIDSNGTVIINGGNVYAFASEKSQDNGLDADKGIYINGGNVVATGNMGDAVSGDSRQAYMQMQFTDKISANTLITITDKSKNPLVAFKGDRSYTILTISTPKLTTEKNIVYEGGTIEGTSENGLYTEITSYTEGTVKSYSSIQEQGMPENMANGMNNININNQKSDVIYLYVMAVLVALLIIAVIIYMIVKNKKESI